MIFHCLFSLVLLFNSCTAYYVTLDANEEKCFFEKVNAGTKIGKQRMPYCSSVDNNVMFQFVSTF